MIKKNINLNKNYFFKNRNKSNGKISLYKIYKNKRNNNKINKK